MNQKNMFWRRWLAAFLFGAALIVFYKTFDNLSRVFAALGGFLSLLTPFTIGFILAFFLYPATVRLENKLSGCKKKLILKRKRSIAIMTVYFGFLAILTVALGVILPRLSVSVADLFKRLPGFVRELYAYLDNLSKEGGLLQNLQFDSLLQSINLQSILQNIFMNDFWSYVEGVKGVTSAVTSFILGVVICAYALLERDSLFKLIRNFFGLFIKRSTLNKMSVYIHRISAIFYMFFFGMVVDSLIIGVLAIAGLALLRVPYAAVLGVVIMVFNMIPYFGPFIGAVPAVLVALLGGGIYQAIWTALFILILQQFDGNLLKPKILGGSVGVSPFWVIFAIVVFGGLFGIWGMVFGVPIIAAIQLLGRDYIAESRTTSETDNKKPEQKTEETTEAAAK